MDFGTQSMVSFAMIKGSAIGRGRRGEFSGYPGSANWPREEGRVRVSTAIQAGHRVTSLGASGYLFFAFCHKQNLGHPKAIGI